MGSLGVRKPVETAKVAFGTSRAGTSNIVDAINGCKQFPHPITPSKCLKQHQTCTRFLSRMKTNYFQSLLATFDSKIRQAITRSVGSKSSSWLTVLPITRHHFDLSAAEFHDSLALPCHRPLFPANCDGCGDVFNLTHALDCRKGGLVTQRHNEVRVAIGDLASRVQGGNAWTNSSRSQ